MNRLEEIKKSVNEIEDYHPEERWEVLMDDVPALVAAVEAVLELHKENVWTNRDGTWTTRTCEHCMSASDGAVTYPCPTVTAINQALGEQA